MLFPDDPVLEQEVARSYLAPVEGRLRRCVLDAFEALKDMAASNILVPGALDYLATRPKNVNSLVVESVRREFSTQEDGYALSEERGFLELRVNDVIDLRFKLVDRSGRSKNTETPTQTRYRNQLPLFGDDDELEAWRLTVGYRWNAAATRIDDVSIIFCKGDEPLWMYSIPCDDQTAAADSHTIRARADGDSPAATRYRSTAKKDSQMPRGG